MRNQFNYRLNIIHSITKDSDKHRHTLEISYYIKYCMPDISLLDITENIAKSIFEKYQNVYLNDIEIFKDDTSIENIAEILFKELSDEIKPLNAVLYQLDVAETPLRVYSIIRPAEIEI